MSCATIRTRSPARRTLPLSSVPTSSRAAISCSPCSPSLNDITEAREITLSVRTFESWAITSSVIPSAKYSFSGSALRLRKGSTATDGTRSRAGAGALSAAAKAAIDSNRSAGSLARALTSACSTAGVTPLRSRRTEGAGSPSCLTSSACTLPPV